MAEEMSDDNNETFMRSLSVSSMHTAKASIVVKLVSNDAINVHFKFIA